MTTIHDFAYVDDCRNDFNYDDVYDLFNHMNNYNINCKFIDEYIMPKLHLILRDDMCSHFHQLIDENENVNFIVYLMIELMSVKYCVESLFCLYDIEKEHDESDENIEMIFKRCHSNSLRKIERDLMNENK